METFTVKREIDNHTDELDMEMKQLVFNLESGNVICHTVVKTEVIMKDPLSSDDELNDFDENDVSNMQEVNCTNSITSETEQEDVILNDIINATMKKLDEKLESLRVNKVNNKTTTYLKKSGEKCSIELFDCSNPIATETEQDNGVYSDITEDTMSNMDEKIESIKRKNDNIETYPRKSKQDALVAKKATVAENISVTEDAINSVYQILKKSAWDRSLEEKLEIKKLGRPIPDLKIINPAKRGRHFNRRLYDQYQWMCGCSHKQAMFCFPCLLFGGNTSWNTTGYVALSEVHRRAKTHELTPIHLNNAINFEKLGRCATSMPKDNQSICQHNEKVKTNRYILNVLVNIIKNCGQLLLPAPSDHGDTSSLEKFKCLLDYTASIDPAFERYLKIPDVADYVSETNQNELINCFFKVYQDIVKKEIALAKHLAVIIIMDLNQEGIVFRYELNGKVVERFWTFLPSDKAGESLSYYVMEALRSVLGSEEEKLIVQSYYGSKIFSSALDDVEKCILATYGYAKLINCHAQQLNSALIHAAVSTNREVGVFFKKLTDMRTFSSNLPPRFEITGNQFDKIILPGFNSWTPSTVFTLKEGLITRFEELEKSDNSEISFEATEFLQLFKDPTFLFWLSLFHNLIPLVDSLLSECQKEGMSSENFKKAMTSYLGLVSSVPKTLEKMDRIDAGDFLDEDKTPGNNRIEAGQIVCDLITAHIQKQFQYTVYLSAANLLCLEKFEEYNGHFPEEIFQETIKAHPSLDDSKLKTELKVIYSRDDFKELKSISSLMNFILSNDLQNYLSQVYSLLRIVYTFPSPIPGSQKFFYNDLSKIKIPVGCNSGRLNGLAASVLGKDLINDFYDFNDQVIDLFGKLTSQQDVVSFKVALL